MLQDRWHKLHELRCSFTHLTCQLSLPLLSDNKLRISILGLFVHIRTRFPNLVTGLITRDSVKEALRNGIGAEQVGAFSGCCNKGDTLLLD